MKTYTGTYGTYYAANERMRDRTQHEHNALYVYRALTAAGWVMPAIAGLLGNMQYESGINPGAWEGYTEGSGGYGLVQWTSAKKYLDWARPRGYAEPSMDGQLARLLWELQTTQTPDKDVQYFQKEAFPLSFTEFTQFSEKVVLWNGLYVSSAYYLAGAFACNYERSSAVLAGGERADAVYRARGQAADDWYRFLQKHKNDEVITMSTKPLYGYWIDSGTVDALPKDRTGILLFNRSKDNPEKMAHVGAYDGGKHTELQIGGYGKTVKLSDGTRKSVASEQAFKANHWTHWAQVTATQDEWDTFLAFIRAKIKRGDMYLIRGHGNTAVIDGVKRVVWDCAGLIVKAVETIGYDFWQGATTMWKRGFEDGIEGEDDDDATDTPTLKKGASGAAVRKLQELLNKHGAEPPLVVDGKFGPNTEEAVYLFQSDYALKTDGIAGPKTWGTLLESSLLPAEEPTPIEPAPSIPATQRMGSRGELVRQLQNLLNKHGAGLRADGIFGPLTKGAVLEYQRKAKIKQDGIVGPVTWGRLLS